MMMNTYAMPVLLQLGDILMSVGVGADPCTAFSSSAFPTHHCGNILVIMSSPCAIQQLNIWRFGSCSQDPGHAPPRSLLPRHSLAQGLWLASHPIKMPKCDPGFQRIKQPYRESRAQYVCNNDKCGINTKELDACSPQWSPYSVIYSPLPL